ncbi:DegV family protein with EDD domain [Melghirimyces profundicolus]|uniref:DegV family protein with EDD domain n=1 Tax=Melghirimyces profundicolus TaxID=1242148 RepID=A0A2T6BSF7_9BACL|nr:DegV family protein [Melghirimyces profundicolus]PTX58877.1 DegV family protein with EDD domain [Melghirimyces profundicolus]
MSVKIITDSASDLPRNIVEEYDIDVIPLLVYQGEEEYLDGETLDSSELFRSMREGKVFKTAQPSLGSLVERFTRYAESGESCLYLAFSSELSGTHQTAVMAREQVLENHPNLDLDILDTKCASVGFGMVVIRAAEMAREGQSKGKILEEARRYAANMEHIFTVDDLEHLFRGGRLSRTAALVGGLLNIKPILHVEDGKLVPLEKVRGRKKAIRRIIEVMKERGVGLQEQTIGICHGDDPEGAEMLKSAIREAFGCERFFVNMIGSAIGAHAGPGTLSVFFQGE